MDGSTVEKDFDFSTGELKIGGTRNGDLADTVYRVTVAGTNDEITRGRTYNSPKTNPKTVRIVAGRYDVILSTIEISGKPEPIQEDIHLEPLSARQKGRRSRAGPRPVQATDSIY